MSSSHSPWVVVLAGGSGTRLQSLTTRKDGVTVPKQFCCLQGGRSLLQDAVARAEQLVPKARVVVVVVAEHATWWQPQLAALPRENLVVQPENRGTAAALLLAVAMIRARDERARIAVMPSDHYVERPRVLLATLQRALHRSALDRQRVFLLGIRPDAPETEYGWIVPGRGDHGVQPVVQFVEKPPLEQATALMADGAVWHSFLLAGDAGALWRLGERRCPEVVQAVAAALAEPLPAIEGALARAYAAMPTLDFARHLLPGSEPLLGLFSVPACGWTDLGTPRRLAECVQRLAQRGPLLREPPIASVDLAQAVREHHITVA